MPKASSAFEEASVLRFGAFEADVATGELRRAGTLVRLQPQPFRLLTLLVRHAGELVTREEIREQLWGGETFVDFEQGENHCIRQIRTALGDDARTPRFVQTVPRRGYRFIARVEPATSEIAAGAPAPTPAEAPASLAASPSRGRGGRRAALISTMLLATATGGIVANGWRDAPRRPRVVVLPFADLSHDGSLAGGLTYEITTELVRTGGAWDVIRLPTLDLPVDPEADYVLEGSVQHAGTRVRVTVQLTGGMPRAPLWADSYENEATDVLSLQAVLTRTIAAEVRARLP